MLSLPFEKDLNSNGLKGMENEENLMKKWDLGLSKKLFLMEENISPGYLKGFVSTFLFFMKRSGFVC